MITEHNYSTLYYPVIHTPDGPRYLGDDWWRLIDDKDDAKLFSHPGDAHRWAERGGHSRKFKLAIVEFPFVVEYQDGPIWQKMRYYRARKVALAGWEDQLKRVVRSYAGNYLWRLRNLKTDEILKQGRPAEIKTSQNVKLPEQPPQVLQTIRFGRKTKFILRTPCTFVEVLQARKVVAEVPTRVADYATGRPDLGKCYYWEWDGLQHQSKPIHELEKQLEEQSQKEGVKP